MTTTLRRVQRTGALAAVAVILAVPALSDARYAVDGGQKRQFLSQVLVAGYPGQLRA
jgi:hypothetical protein